MAAEKETVKPVAQEQTIHVHDASGDEHIQPKPIAISTPAMVLEVMVIWISMTKVSSHGLGPKERELDPRVN